MRRTHRGHRSACSVLDDPHAPGLVTLGTSARLSASGAARDDARNDYAGFPAATMSKLDSRLRSASKRTRVGGTRSDQGISVRHRECAGFQARPFCSHRGRTMKFDSREQDDEMPAGYRASQMRIASISSDRTRTASAVPETLVAESPRLSDRDVYAKQISCAQVARGGVRYFLVGRFSNCLPLETIRGLRS